MRLSLAFRLRLLRRLKKFIDTYRFSTITGRIIVLNFFGVMFLVAGILYLNDSRANLIETRVVNLSTQAAIIASAIAQTSTHQGDSQDDFGDSYGISFRINPEHIAPMLRDLVGPTKTRARIYDVEGNLLLDSQQLYAPGQVGIVEPHGAQAGQEPDLLNRIWTWVRIQLGGADLPVYRDMGADGKAYDEVRIALTGSPAPLIRLTEEGDTIISVAMPVQKRKTILGALLLTTQGSDIDEIIAAARWKVVEVAGLVVIVTAILAWLLAGTIAGPLHRLVVAAERVRKNIKTREQIPDFSHRSDEIGRLSRSFSDMTKALYSRLEAIESFAADVSHELKNPLTSLRNAAAMLGRVKTEEDRTKLTDIIQQDVKRLDRLITDISHASRLDAELARETAKPLDVAKLLTAMCEVTAERWGAAGPEIVLEIEDEEQSENAGCYGRFLISGHGSRLSQVITNLLDNAQSFSPSWGKIYVTARRVPKKDEIEITVEDDGPGIPPDNLERIFRRFYTDRPQAEVFGQNSGLGLNICQQIIKAHNGRIWAENRQAEAAPAKAPAVRLKAAAIAGQKRGELALAKAALREGEEETFRCGTAKRHAQGARFVIRMPALDVVDAG